MSEFTTNDRLNSLSGNALLKNSSGAYSTTGNISANYFLGNGSQLTGISGGGGTPGGSNTQIQFNNSGAFGGSANLIWNGNLRLETNNIQLGLNAGQTSQGESAVAVGSYAGQTSQANNSIVINATGTALQNTTANSFVISPIRNDTGNTTIALFYNTSTNEVTYTDSGLNGRVTTTVKGWNLP